MEEEKKSLEQPPVRTLEADMDDLKNQMSLVKWELSEIRAAFYNLVNEMRNQTRELKSGMATCHRAFLHCKVAYENCKKGYEEMTERVEDELTSLGGTMPMNWD